MRQQLPDSVAVVRYQGGAEGVEEGEHGTSSAIRVMNTLRLIHATVKRDPC
jgi:hypothetical protein